MMRPLASPNPLPEGRPAEVITEARLLCLVEKKPLVEICLGVLRNFDPNHGLPKVPFTESQSRSRVSPPRTLAATAIQQLAQTALESLPRSPMIWILRSTGRALTSSVTDS